VSAQAARKAAERIIPELWIESKYPLMHAFSRYNKEDMGAFRRLLCMGGMLRAQRSLPETGKVVAGWSHGGVTLLSSAKKLGLEGTTLFANCCWMVKPSSYV
jgi:hypothetical protein